MAWTKKSNREAREIVAFQRDQILILIPQFTPALPVTPPLPPPLPSASSTLPMCHAVSACSAAKTETTSTPPEMPPSGGTATAPIESRTRQTQWSALTRGQPSTKSTSMDKVRPAINLLGSFRLVLGRLEETRKVFDKSLAIKNLYSGIVFLIKNWGHYCLKGARNVPKENLGGPEFKPVSDFIHQLKSLPLTECTKVKNAEKNTLYSALKNEGRSPQEALNLK